MLDLVLLQKIAEFVINILLFIVSRQLLNLPSSFSHSPRLEVPESTKSLRLALQEINEDLYSKETDSCTSILFTDDKLHGLLDRLFVGDEPQQPLKPNQVICNRSLYER